MTLSGSDVGTDDHIYIGVEGTGGGRECPLVVAEFNDFERGTNVLKNPHLSRVRRRELEGEDSQ